MADPWTGHLWRCNYCRHRFTTGDGGCPLCGSGDIERIPDNVAVVQVQWDPSDPDEWRRANIAYVIMYHPAADRLEYVQVPFCYITDKPG